MHGILPALAKGCWRVVAKIKSYYTLIGLGCVAIWLSLSVIYYATAHADTVAIEPIKACVLEKNTPLSGIYRSKISQCIGWEDDSHDRVCHGFYKPLLIKSLDDPNEIQLSADSISVYPKGVSQLIGDVYVRQTQRIITAQTANVYRDAKTKEITRIELIDNVHYIEPDKLMIAKKATINPRDKSGFVEDVLYRFNTNRAGAKLPAWGRASLVQRFANQNYLLRKATYTTCSPKDNAWQIDADKLTLDHDKASGVARNAILRVADMPILYTPYLSFPTSKARKSGFLMPLFGYSNVSGFDYALPYYLNIAPNFDATLVPHVYTLRGLMLGGNARFLTEHSTGIVGGNILPSDAAYRKFINEHKEEFPILQGASSNRWSMMVHENTRFTSNLNMDINYQQVSDDYYLQDFSTNLAVSTENQLLRQGDLSYTTDHWLLHGMLQSYQTLHPINQSEVADIYERLPQLSAQGNYYDLPLHANLSILSQFDYFHWTGATISQPQGPRYHLNPILSLPQIKPWGYVTPEVQLVENNYNLTRGYSPYNDSYSHAESFNRAIPRYSLNSGLTFERNSLLFHDSFTQTLEPRFYYLNVPYKNQSQFPAFDSAYMIFNTDQLFRDNRFSGFDRIGDANQLAYAATTRWISSQTGREMASITVGQLRYFSDRRVELCYSENGDCVDSPLFLGYTSPVAEYSPIASKASYALSSAWAASADYVWDPYTSATNNGNLNLHYQPTPNKILSFGYNYIVSGNVLETPESSIQDNALHQATVSYAWPLNEKWSSLGVYSYNISKQYGMLTFFGLQYDSCCWAARLIGGRTFKSLGIDSLSPQYNNNVYFQVLLKGLGSVANSDPASTIQSYLPGYPNIFGR